MDELVNQREPKRKAHKICTKDLKEAIDLLKKNKVSYFKQGDLVVQFAHDAFESDLTPDSKAEEVADDENLAFLSSGVRIKKKVKRDRQEERS